MSFTSDYPSGIPDRNFVDYETAPVSMGELDTWADEEDSSSPHVHKKLYPAFHLFQHAKRLTLPASFSEYYVSVKLGWDGTSFAPEMGVSAEFLRSCAATLKSRFWLSDDITIQATRNLAPGKTDDLLGNPEQFFSSFTNGFKRKAVTGTETYADFELKYFAEADPLIETVLYHKVTGHLMQSFAKQINEQCIAAIASIAKQVSSNSDISRICGQWVAGEGEACPPASVPNSKLIITPYSYKEFKREIDRWNQSTSWLDKSLGGFEVKVTEEVTAGGAFAMLGDFSHVMLLMPDLEFTIQLFGNKLRLGIACTTDPWVCLLNPDQPIIAVSR